MRVEDIRDDSTVIMFVKKYYLENREECKINKVGFCFKGENLYVRDSTISSYYNSIKAPRWIKSDLNKDGKDDLIFSGCVGFSEKIICFLSTEDQKYVIKNVTPDFRPESYFVRKIDNNYLIVGSIDLYNFDTTKELLKSIDYDTILLLNKGLVQFSSAKRKTIDKCILNFKIALMPDEYTIVIKKDDLLHMNKVENYDFIEHSFRMSIDKEKIKNFFDIAENLPYYKYKNEYWGAADDGYDWNTTIYFNDGSIMNISDHMGIAPFGLRTLYDIAYKLFKDENWKKID